MSDKSRIEWTDATWNPVRGCSRVSEGCRNCYAERVAARFSGSSPSGIMRAAERPQKVGEVSPPFAGFAYPTKAGPRWTGRVELIPEKLDEPLRWKKPRRIFVNSMSDLFHEKLSVETIAKVFSVMGAAWWHTYQILTKRPERMAAVLPEVSAIIQSEGRAPLGPLWKHVWLGVSVEDQASFDARVLPLVSTPAALRFISYEPAIGPLDCSLPVSPMATPLLLPRDPKHGPGCVHWLIVGGESGPGARPFNIGWAYSAVAQCRAARVPVFIKQLGARPYELMGSPPDYGWLELRDRKGGDPEEWPEDLRVREFPETNAA